tara:strand:- start:143 stop:1603 length:1461 start_codon:yes stop_codon:yes gene_type:complete
MKLIRIASSDQLTGLFSNEFSEAITLPPQSKIALLNGMFASDSKSISIPVGTTISFSPKNSVSAVSATLPEGNYSQTTLITTLRQLMNQALPRATMNTVCFVWDVSTSQKGVVSLSFLRTKAQAMDFSKAYNMNVSSAGVFVATSDGSSDTAGQFKNYAYSDKTVLPYNNVIRIRPFRNSTANNTVPFIFGLLNEKPDTSSKTFLSAADFMFGIESDGVNIRYIYNGAVITGQTYLVGAGTNQVNPKKATGINIVFTRNAVNYTDTAETVHTIPIDFNVKGFTPAIGLRNTTDSIRDTFYTPNPYESSSIANATITGYDYPLPTTLHLDESLVGASPHATIVTVTMNEKMRVVLGFDTDPVPLQAINGSYVAQTPIQISNTPTSITVECPNLGGLIESYDGISQKRRPIVAVIPAMEQTSGMLTYQPGYPMFIDLNNRFPIQLSKLEVRLLSSFDDTEVNLERPGASLTFALDHSNPQNTTGLTTK